MINDDFFLLYKSVGVDRKVEWGQVYAWIRKWGSFRSGAESGGTNFQSGPESGAGQTSGQDMNVCV